LKLFKREKKIDIPRDRENSASRLTGEVASNSSWVSRLPTYLAYFSLVSRLLKINVCLSVYVYIYTNTHSMGSFLLLYSN
jgi:hypothetical protein